MIGGYEDGSADGAARPKWRSVSLQGCPREVRRLLAGPYYFDVDMVNSLPNVARQLGRRGMVGAANLRALSTLCSERDTVLAHIVEFYGLTDEPAQGVTARDRAKDLPIRILHGGGHAAWLDRVPGLRGAFIIASTPYSCVGFGDQHRGPHRGSVVLLSV